jgi:hypothetical protein
MDTIFNPSLKAHLSLDENQKVRHVRHSQEYWLSEENIPRLAASRYLNDVAETLQIPREQLRSLHKKAQYLSPSEQGVEYQLDEEKQLFDSTTISYYQTYLNVPVWRRGLSVKVKQGPNRIVSATNNSEDDLEGELPDQDVIDRYRKTFHAAASHRVARAAGLEEDEADETTPFVRRALRVSARAAAKRDDRARLLSGKFFVYKYDPDKRFAGKLSPPDEKTQESISLEEGAPPFIRIPPVSDDIQTGRAYLVAELIFRYDLPGYDELVWLALVEPETGSILYLECMTCGVNGLVFRRDPMVSSGDLTATSDDANSVLQNHDSDEVLNALDPPSGGTQNLSGTYVFIQNETDPNVAPPTRPAGSDFDYQPRTNEFAAVNAYYHQTELFRVIEDLGFPILGGSSYFDGTSFPLSVDHRGLGNVINAHWVPNGTGGTDHMCYALCDTTNTTDPLGRAVDPWVHWHEMGGHGTLGDHVGSGLFGFAHSAGDGLAAIQNDPESALRALPERFRYAPFRPFTTERRFDRPVPAWAWGSASDDGNYGSEQILATCHFRIYRSIGGDHNNVGRRKFASRVVTYLILRTIGNLTPATNPSNWDPAAMTNVPGRGAELWCEEMQDTDLENWTSEGLSGGAYNKLIRWAFEEQGSYGGDPPQVDVYIDDGRAGEYQFQAVHWHNTSMWNRNSPDGLLGHQNAVSGATNYMYVKVKNRGTSQANNVVVKGYHCLPGAGLTWPVDFTAMAPAAGLPVATIGANNSEEVTLGPFEWVPNENIYGHDCVLMIASTAGDPSNVDNFTGAETIEEWRLVPHDNNVGQRNVTIVPGGGEGEALISAIDGAVFLAGNSFNRPARMELRVEMPKVLASKGWGLDLGDGGDRFRLRPGEKRRIRLKLVEGNDFTTDEIRGSADRDIKVDLYANDMLLGGMTYYVDPELRERSGGRRPERVECRDAARDLLDCLKVSGGGNIKEVRVKKVSVDIELGGGRDCD